MGGSSILPVSIHNGKIYFLFGKERNMDETPGWSDFGGGIDRGETPRQTAIREGSEELTGFLGDIRALFRRGVYPLVWEGTRGKYHVHIVKLPYDDALVTYYNNNQRFLQSHLSRNVIKHSKIFEKSEIRWISFEDMQKMRLKFRPFYRNIVDLILSERTEISRWIRGGK